MIFSEWYNKQCIHKTWQSYTQINRGTICAKELPFRVQPFRGVNYGLIPFICKLSDRLPRLGKRELIFLLSFTCIYRYVVFLKRGFLFLLVPGIGCFILLWHSLGLPYNNFGCVFIKTVLLYNIGHSNMFSLSELLHVCTLLLQQEPAGTAEELLNGLKHVRPGGGFVPNFPLTAKSDVNGDKQLPLYSYLKVHKVFVFTFFIHL